MITRWHDFDRLFSTMNLLRDSLDRFPVGGERFARWTSDWPSEQNSPKTNLYDTGDSFAVWIEVPGVSKDHLTVKLQGNYLEISGKREIAVPEGFSVHRMERKETAFTRSFTLPAEVEFDKVEARLENGILTLNLPKAAAAKPRQIDIQ